MSVNTEYCQSMYFSVEHFHDLTFAFIVKRSVGEGTNEQIVMDDIKRVG